MKVFCDYVAMLGKKFVHPKFPRITRHAIKAASIPWYPWHSCLVRKRTEKTPHAYFKVEIKLRTHFNHF